MKKYLLVVLFFSLNVRALEGTQNLETKLYQKNLEYQAQNDLVESKKALYKASYSGFYPTLNAVGGWGQNKTDDLPAVEKGYLVYLEGRANIFKGFKDHSVLKQREADLNISQIDLEFIKRDLRLQMTELVSEMIYHHRLQEILQEEFKTTQLQKQMAAKKVSAGLTGSVDNVEFDLRENEIEIEIKQIEQLHKEGHQKLIKQFGEDILDTDLENIVFSSAEKSVSSMGDFKYENNINYKKSELLKNKFELEKSEIKSEFMPSLDLTYAVGRITPSEDSPLKYNEYKYGIVLTVPLFSGFETYYKNKSATQQLASAEKLQNQKRIEIESDYSILKNKIKAIYSLYLINDKKLVNSQKYFDLTLGEYKRGIKNSPDLVGATDRLFLAKKKKYELLKELEALKVKIENIF